MTNLAASVPLGSLTAALHSVNSVRVLKGRLSTNLQRITISADADGLKITGTNFLHWATATVPLAEVESFGSVDVHPGLIRDLLKMVNKSRSKAVADRSLVYLKQNGDDLQMVTNDTECVLKGLGDRRVLPAVPDLSAPVSAVSVKAEDLIRGVASSVKFASRDETTLTHGVLVATGDNGEVSLLSTDRYRLDRNYLSPTGSVGRVSQYKMIIGHQALKTLVPALKGVTETVELQLFEEGHLKVILPNIEFVFSEIEGDYPRIHNLFDFRVGFRASIDLKALQSAVDAVSPATGMNIPVQLNFGGDGKLTVEIDSHEANVKRVIDYENMDNSEPVKVGFNASYLSEAISVIEGDKVYLETNVRLASPVRMYGDAPAHDHLLMPIRLVN